MFFIFINLEKSSQKQEIVEEKELKEEEEEEKETLVSLEYSKLLL